MARKGNPHYRPWTLDEEAALREAWETGPLATARFLTDHPWRNDGSTRARAAKLGLTGRVMPYRLVGYDLSAEVWAYIAGIIDGEGGIYFYGREYGRRRMSQVTVTNTCVALLDQLDAWLPGGRRYESHGAERRLRCFTQRWATWHHALHICEGILPYLIIKKERAMTLIEQTRADHGLA